MSFSLYSKNENELGIFFFLFICVIIIEFEEEDNLFGTDRDQVAISIEDDVQAEKQRKATGFSPNAEEDTLASDDKTEV